MYYGGYATPALRHISNVKINESLCGVTDLFSGWVDIICKSPITGNTIKVETANNKQLHFEEIEVYTNDYVSDSDVVLKSCDQTLNLKFSGGLAAGRIQNSEGDCMEATSDGTVKWRKCDFGLQSWVIG